MENIEIDYINMLTNVAEQEMAEVDDEPVDTNLMDVFDRAGEIGVAEFVKRPLGDLLGILGLDRKAPFPFFNRYMHEQGALPKDIENFQKYEDSDYSEESIQKAYEEAMLRPLKPYWHQYVALAAMAKMVFHGRNVLLADGVGVGKTLECLMLVAYLRHMILVEWITGGEWKAQRKILLKEVKKHHAHVAEEKKKDPTVQIRMSPELTELQRVSKGIMETCEKNKKDLPIPSGT